MTIAERMKQILRFWVLIACLFITTSVHAQEFTASIAVRQGICFTGATNGVLEIHISGGIAPYSVWWSTGDSLPAIDSLAEGGTYSATVTDNIGATALTGNFVFRRSSTPLSTVVRRTKNADCAGKNNASAWVEGIGGVPPYRYQWSVNNWQFDEIYNLPAGTYTLTVTDDVNCTATRTLTLTEPQPLDFIADQNSPSCSTCADGSLRLQPRGGSPTYIYALEPNGEPQFSNFFPNLAVGDYTFTMADGKGCMFTKTVRLGYTAPPCNPNIIQSTTGGNTYITLQWTNSPAATRYIISWRKNRVGEIWNSVSVESSNNLSYVVNGLIPNTEYEFRVRVRCEDRLSDWSESVVQRTLPVNAPVNCTPPQLRTLTPARTYLDADWQSVNPASRYIISWRIKRSGESWNSLSALNLTEPSFRINGLIPGYWYEVRLRSRCGNALSDWSEVKEVRLLR